MRILFRNLIAIALIITAACEKQQEQEHKFYIENDTNWAIPSAAIYDGGPGKDGIPALVMPDVVATDGPLNDYLNDEDYILVYKTDDVIRGYPHPILNWHEIVNDRLGNKSIAITYCPLTGTGIGWNRIIKGTETTFGVSGFLYISNLIPYDRLTESHWSQMRMDCVRGDLKGLKAVTFPLVEMKWKSWKELFPDEEVVSIKTGYNKPYEFYPYGNYRTDKRLIFPLIYVDERMHPKERVHVIISDTYSRAYVSTLFGEKISLINDTLNGQEIVLAGKVKDYMVSFLRMQPDGTILEFHTDEGFPEMMLDNEGNIWNIFGEAVSGPRSGERLTPTTSFIGYWFSIAAFYPKTTIYKLK